MNQVAGNQMRLYDLPSKLLCRVLNVELKVRPLPARVFPQFRRQLASLLSSPSNFCLDAYYLPQFQFSIGGDGHRRGLRTDHAYARARGSLLTHMVDFGRVIGGFFFGFEQMLTRSLLTHAAERRGG
jgi:hypothetical protein